VYKTTSQNLGKLNEYNNIKENLTDKTSELRKTCQHILTKYNSGIKYLEEFLEKLTN